MTVYKVACPYLTCHSREAAVMVRPAWKQELAMSGWNAGQILPQSVPADEIERFLAAGLIKAVE